MAIDYHIQSYRTVPISGGGSFATVASPCINYCRMAVKWELIDDLLGGTSAMRDKMEKWLPREPNESPLTYSNRLRRSFLYNAIRDTVEKLVAKPFSRAVNLSGKVPERLVAIETNTDRMGHNLTQVARQAFEVICSHGIYHILVDYPNLGGRVPSVAEEKDGDIRPFFVGIDPHNLIGWQSEKDETGIDKLTQIRIREFRMLPKGSYGDQEQEFIRVINAEGTWELHTKDAKGNWYLYDSGTHSFNGIPLVTVYAKKKDFMVAYPPLEDLAELNLCHWQSSSDQRSALRFARIGVIAMTGLTAEEAEKPVTIAPNSTLRSQNPEAKFYYVENSGGAIQAGERDLDHLEKLMEVMGMQPMIARTQADTATAKLIDESKTETSIQTWIRALERALTICYELAGEWINEDLPDDFSIDIFSDFGIMVKDAADLEFLYKLRQSAGVTQEVFLREVKRRGILAETVDVKAQLTETEDERKKLAELAMPPTDNPQPVTNPGKPRVKPVPKA